METAWCEGRRPEIAEDAERIGTSLAEQLLSDGADEILRQIRTGR